MESLALFGKSATKKWGRKSLAKKNNGRSAAEKKAIRSTPKKRNGRSSVDW